MTHNAYVGRTHDVIDGQVYLAVCAACGWQGTEGATLQLAQIEARGHNKGEQE